MATSHSLKILLQHAQHLNDASAKRLGQLNSEHLKAEQKLQLLLDYRNDYNAGFQDAMKNGIEQIAWQNFLVFMGKLDAAISEQRKAVARSQQNKEAGGEDFLARQRTLKSYDTLSKRLQHAEALRLEKREQHDLDERAARQAENNSFTIKKN